MRDYAVYLPSVGLELWNNLESIGIDNFNYSSLKTNKEKPWSILKVSLRLHKTNDVDAAGLTWVSIVTL